MRKRQEERHHRGGKQKMRKLGMKIAVAAAIFCMAMPFASFAGTWKSDANGMWYQFDDGSYPKGRWAWIDTDNDGMAESFYFDENGYVLRNTTTPDGYQVNRIGAWVVGGEVKQKAGGETRNSSSGTSGNSSGGSNSNSNSNNSGYWNYGYNYDPDWYLKADYLSEIDKAAYHYSSKYYNWDAYNPDEIAKVREQVDRIAANPCDATASAEMVSVEIPVWRLRNGQKVAGTAHVQVLSSIANDVKEIFTEIYNGPEQFPIESVGGYNWRSNGLGSNHSSGTAIDINPDANPQIDVDGTTVLGGNKWEPGVDPYSIGRDRDVVKAFGKHGWNWGAGLSRADMMHFDY